MRPTVGFAGLLMGALGACAVDTGQPPRLAYAPPEARPTESSSASVGQPAGLIWNQLLDRLIQASLQIDLADPERGIIVARYSGDPEPYVTCGWIVVGQGGDAEQVPAVGDASFKRMVEGHRLEVNRGMTLDARLVVEVKPGGDEAAVKTGSNYVLTKTIVAADRSGRQRGSSREVVSFSGGGRGKFGKGTICQATGALERVVLDVLPRAAQLAGNEVSTNTQTAELGADAENTNSASTFAMADDSTPASALQTTEIGELSPAASSGEDSQPEAAIMESEIVSPKIAGVPPLEEGKLPLECPVADKTYCAILEITGPYRRANQEGGLGLTVDAIEPGSPLLTDSDLGFDVGLPGYEAYLTVSMFLKDGTVRHVLSGWDRRWPAHAREFVGDGGLSVEDRQDVELVVALASDVPVFSAPRPPSETAELFLDDLRQRLAEISNGAAPARIAASLIVVTPA